MDKLTGQTIPATRDGSDFGEGQLEQHLFLIIDHVDAGPIDGDDHVVLGKTRTGELVRLVEAREQQWPPVARVVDNVLFDLERRYTTADEVAVRERLLDLAHPERVGPLSR